MVGRLKHNAVNTHFAASIQFAILLLNKLVVLNGDPSESPGWRLQDECQVYCEIFAGCWNSQLGYKIIIIYRKELLIVWHLPYKQVNQFDKVCYFKALMSYI
jgi:hypothetical protein